MEWIPANKEQPENGKTVFIYTEDNEPGLGRYINGGWEITLHYEDIYLPTLKKVSKWLKDAEAHKSIF